MHEPRARADDVLEITVTPGEGGLRLDSLLCRRFRGLSRAGAAKIARSRLHGGPLKPGSRVRPGQKILVGLSYTPRTEPDFALRLLHEDATLLVVDKPAGQLVHPPRRGITNTLVECLVERYGAGISLPHRLDRETSGVLVAARSPGAARELSRLFQGHRVEKTYLAVVEGVPTPPEGMIDLPLGKAEDSLVRDRQAVMTLGGRRAQTMYRTLRVRGERSLVEARPRTGRLHQIRVHLAALGTPVVGDKIYGPDEGLFLRFLAEGFSEELREKLILPRHALHAHRVAFVHPETARPVEFTAPLPEELAELVE